MNQQANPINLAKLKTLLSQGIECIPHDPKCQEAVIVIGDTGVGKSTIMSFLYGDEMIVKMDGLKPVLANVGKSVIKIGHEKFSETSIPTKVLIQGMAFYDCPGFKDNKGEQYEISNSFFVQRLLDIYPKVKIVLVIDESHISEDRADKLPKLLRNLHKSFKSFSDIQDGCCILINRASEENSQQDYQEELLRLIELQNEEKYLFEIEERDFVKFLIKNNRILLFKQPNKEMKGQKFVSDEEKDNITKCIKSMRLVKSKKIQNIISENAKLAIRDFIDDIARTSNKKIQIICQYILEIYQERMNSHGRNLNGVIALKQEIIKFAESIKVAKKQNIINIFQKELPPEKLQDFEEDFASIMFFKEIYDKTDAFFSNFVNKIYSELSHLLTYLDEQITAIQKLQEEEKMRELQKLEEALRQQRHEQERIQAERLCETIEDLKKKTINSLNSNKDLVNEVETAMKSLSSISSQIEAMRQSTLELLKMNQQLSESCDKALQTNCQLENIKT